MNNIENSDICKSIQEYERALKLTPNGVKGMHKFFSVYQYPAFYEKGNGCMVYDMDGNEYIDFVMGKGAYILGYKNEQINNAIINQISKGNIFPMGNVYQNKVSTSIINMVPNVEKVVFYKTGSCATSASVRIARAVTGKNIILSSGYHGWHDWCNSGKGILDAVKNSFIDFQYNLDKFDFCLEKYMGQIAGVIVTPEEYYLEESFYRYIQNKCKENNIIYIIDEIKSGFRIDVGGFQKKYNLEPDIVTYSKALSNGYSISVVAGKEKYIDVCNEIHTTGTYDLETIPYVAAEKCLDIIKKFKVPDRIEKTGKEFVKKLDNLFKEYGVEIYPYFSSGSFRLWSSNEEIETSFYENMAKEKVIFYAYDNSFISLAHSEDILEEVLLRVKKVLSRKCLTSTRTFNTFKTEYLINDFKSKKNFLQNYVGTTGRLTNE